MLFPLINWAEENVTTHPFKQEEIKTVPPLPIVTTKSEANVDLSTFSPEGSQISDFDARLIVARAYSYRKLHQKDALKQYKILLSEDPDNSLLLFETGNVLLSLKKYKEALEYLYPALKKNPNINTLRLLAVAEASLGHAVKSNQLMEKVLSFQVEDSNSFEDLIVYADLLMSWGDFNKAECIYRDALKHNPESLPFALKLAKALTYQHRYQDAERLYKYFLLSHSGDKKILKGLINLKIFTKDFNAALEYADQLLYFYPKPRHSLIKSDILYLAGNYEQSKIICEIFFVHQPSYINAHIGFGKNLFKLNRYDEGKKAFKTVLEIEPDNIPAQYYLGVMNEHEDCFIETIVKKALTVKDLEKWTSLYLENGNTDAPRFLYEAMLKIDADYFPAKLNLYFLQTQT